jgi:hypothetical protein
VQHIYLAVYLAVHLDIYLAVYLAVYLLVHLAVHLDIYLPVYLAVYLAVNIAVYLDNNFLLDILKIVSSEIPLQVFLVFKIWPGLFRFLVTRCPHCAF